VNLSLDAGEEHGAEAAAPSDAERWELPSCSQVDPQTMAEIGGVAGEEVRREYERQHRQRAVATRAAAAEGSSTSAAASSSSAAGSNAGGPASARRRGGASASDPSRCGWRCEACTFEHTEPAEQDFLSCTICHTTRNLAAAPLESLHPPHPPPHPPPNGSPSRSPRGGRGGGGAHGPSIGRAGRSRGRSAARNADQPRRSPFEQPSGRYWSLAPPPSADGAPPPHREPQHERRGERVHVRPPAARSLGHEPLEPTDGRQEPHGSWLDTSRRHGSCLAEPPRGLAEPSPHALSLPSAGPPHSAPRLLEPWDAVRPHLSEWLENEDAPEAEDVLAYAKALIGAARLDELACLARFLERQCLRHARCWPMLHAFVEGVDAAVVDKFGGKLQTLKKIRCALAAAQREL